MSAGLLVVLVGPVVGVGLTATVRGRRRAGAGCLTAASVAVAALVLARELLAEGRAQVAVWSLPIGVDVALVADGLAVALLAMTAVVATAVTGFASVEDRRQPDRRHRAYWPLLFSLWAGLNVLFLAGDLVTTYLMLELIAVCGALLVTLRGDRGSLLAGTRYFYAELAASTTMLVGVALVWSQTGTVTYAELGAALDTAPAGTAVGTAGLALVTAGLLLKVPLAPLHFWLPAAHTLAPSAVSPVLSAVMVKAAFAVIVRLWFLAVPGALTTSAAQLLGALGAVAIVWGSVTALRATGLKRLIASSTVAQLGLLFLLPPLVRAGEVDAWTGGIVLAVTHAVAKAAMLMAAAVIVDSARRAGFGAGEEGEHVTEAAQLAADAESGGPVREGPARPAADGGDGGPVRPVPARAAASTETGGSVRRRPARASAGEPSWPVLVQLRGSVARRPVAVMAFGIAGLSLVGLPPTGGFVAKWYLLLASVAAGQWWWVAVLVVGTLLTVGYLMRFVRPAFAPPDAGAGRSDDPAAGRSDDPAAPPERVEAERDGRDLVALALASVTVVIGLRPGPLIDLLTIGGPELLTVAARAVGG